MAPCVVEDTMLKPNGHDVTFNNKLLSTFADFQNCHLEIKTWKLGFRLKNKKFPLKLSLWQHSVFTVTPKAGEVMTFLVILLINGR